MEQVRSSIAPCPMFSEAMNTAGTTEQVSIAMDGQQAKLSFKQYYNVMMDGAINQDERYYLKHGFCTRISAINQDDKYDNNRRMTTMMSLTS